MNTTEPRPQMKIVLRNVKDPGMLCRAQGCLLGQFAGDAVPNRWTETVLNCRPEDGQPGVYRPRPKSLWPVDALKLAKRLLAPNG